MNIEGKKSIKKPLLYRVDGGNVWGISMGHLKRALIIVEKLHEDYDILFVMKNYPEGISYIKQKGWNICIIDPNDESDETIIELCEQYKPNKVIFDLNSNNYVHFFKYARSKKIQTIVFDITGMCSGAPDIIINDSFVPQLIQYPNIDRKTKIYTGPKYFILDNPPEFVPIRQNVEDILITFGGSDPADLTLKFLEHLLPHFKNCTINIILGPAYSKHNKIKEMISNNPFVHLYINPPNFLWLLSTMDVVITAAGRTLYECAYLGRPTIIIPSIEHEAETSNEFSKRTGSFNINIWNNDSSPEKIKNALNVYYQDYKFRSDVSVKSRRLIDGNGLFRVLKLIE